MSFIDSHPGFIYLAVTIVQLVALIVIACAAVSISKSLKGKKQ